MIITRQCCYKILKEGYKIQLKKLNKYIKKLKTTWTDKNYAQMVKINEIVIIKKKIPKKQMGLKIAQTKHSLLTIDKLLKTIKRIIHRSQNDQTDDTLANSM